MAEQDVVIVLRADVEKLQADLNKVKGQMAGVEASGKRGMTTISNETKKAEGAATKARSMFQKLGITIGLAFAVRSVVNFAKESIKAYREAQVAETKLLAALNGRRDIQERLLQQAKQIQRTTVFGDEEVINAQAFMAAQGRTEEQIKKTIDAAKDLSVVTGDSLEGAVRKLDMTYEGSIGRMGRLESSLTKLTKEQLASGTAVDVLAKKYEGMAQAMAQTDAGRIKQLSNAYNDLQESIGAGMSEAIADAAGRLTMWTRSLTDAFKPDQVQQINQQKELFKLLGESAIKPNLTMERRIDLVKQMQAIEPGFLANMDLERVTAEQVAQAYSQSLAVFEAQVQAKKMAIIQEEMYNEVADRQLSIDQRRKEASDKLADGYSHVSSTFQDIAFGAGEVASEISNWMVPVARFVPAYQEMQAKMLTSFADIEEAALKLAESNLGVLESLKSLAAEGWDKNNPKVKEYEKYMRMMGADDGAIAKFVLRLKEMNKEMGVQNETVDTVTGAYQRLSEEINQLETQRKDLLAAGQSMDEADLKHLETLKKQKERIDGVTKSAGQAKTAYERLTEAIGKLNEKLLQQIMSGKGDIEVTKQQLVQKTALKKQIDSQNESLQEYIELMTTINKMEAKPTVEIPVTVTLPDEIASGEMPYSEQFISTAEQMGVDSGAAFVGAFIDWIDIQNFGFDDATTIIETALGEIAKLFSDFDETNLKSIDSYIDELDQRTSATTDALDREIELNKQGLASNVALRQKELDEINVLRRQAENEREKEIAKQRKQAKTLAAIQAAASAVRIISDAVQTGGVVGLITGALALAGLLTMLSTGQNQAESSIQFAHGNAEILDGRSHSGGGVSLGNYGEAEKGEFLGILSKQKTDKFGKPMLSLFEGINHSNGEKIATGLLGIAGLSSPEFSGGGSQTVELKEQKELKGMYDIMRRPTKTTVYENGKRIEKNGNITRIIYN